MAKHIARHRLHMRKEHDGRVLIRAEGTRHREGYKPERSVIEVEAADCSIAIDLESSSAIGGEHHGVAETVTWGQDPPIGSMDTMQPPNGPQQWRRWGP